MTSTYRRLLQHVEWNGRARSADQVRRLLWMQRGKAFSDRSAVNQKLSAAADRLRAAGRHLVQAMRPPPNLDAAIDGYADSYRTARRESHRKIHSDAPMHRWRKRTKTLIHHCALLGMLRPEVMKAWRHEFSALDDLLGEEHDLEVLDGYLKEHRQGAHADEIKDFRRLIKARRDELRTNATRLGRLFFSAKPADLKRGLVAWAGNAGRNGVAAGDR
jgi:hypothetical protein